MLLLQHLASQQEVRVSVEVEKVGRGFEDFIPLADVVFVSKVIHLELASSQPLFNTVSRVSQMFFVPTYPIPWSFFPSAAQCSKFVLDLSVNFCPSCPK